MKKLKKGVFVVFEGGESCGKTLQQNLCFDYFSSKYDTIKMREPGSSPISEGIRSLLLNPEMQMSYLTELMLYGAARAQFVNDLLKPNLEQHKLVLCDRFFYSTVAYQGFGRIIDLKTIDLLNEITTQGIKPDIAFISSITYEESLRRMQKSGKVKDRIESEERGFHERVQEGYAYITENYLEAISIDGSLDPKTISKMVVTEIEECLSKYL